MNDLTQEERQSFTCPQQMFIKLILRTQFKIKNFWLPVFRMAGGNKTIHRQLICRDGLQFMNIEKNG